MTSVGQRVRATLQLRTRLRAATHAVERGVLTRGSRQSSPSLGGSTTIGAVVVSVPDRHRLLTQALKSIRAQTRPPDDVVVGIDAYRLGEVDNMNRLLRATDCEWVAFLHDDDLWAPEHLATAEQFMTEDHDVVVARFRLVGRPRWTIEGWHDDFADLRTTNWFPPSCVVVRRTRFDEWCQPFGKYEWADWANWVRLLDAGARFTDTRTSTVRYRFGWWDNGSWR